MAAAMVMVTAVAVAVATETTVKPSVAQIESTKRQNRATMKGPHGSNATATRGDTAGPTALIPMEKNTPASRVRTRQTITLMEPPRLPGRMVARQTSLTTSSSDECRNLGN